MTLTLPQVKFPAAPGRTPIEWTDYTFNPIRAVHKVTGKVGWACQKVAAGCVNCYAEKINLRYGTGERYDAEGNKNVALALDEQRIAAALTWKPKGPHRRGEGSRPMVFVCDMCDLFDERLEFETIDRVFALFALRPEADWQVLTKRPRRMAEYLNSTHERESAVAELSKIVPERGFEWKCPSFRLSRPWGNACVAWPLPNVWLGCSVANQRDADENLPYLLRCPAAVRFVSYEPAVGAVDIWRAVEVAENDPTYQRAVADRPYVHGETHLQWLIVGGESGPRARECDAAWLRSAVAQAKSAGVPVFVKQLGSNSTVVTTCKGGDPSEWPADLNVREWPKQETGQ